MRKNHCSRSRCDEVAGALAGAVGEHLLVGEHGLAARAPVDRGLGPVGQAGLPKAQEDDLVPLDVLGVVAADLPAPVVDGAEPDQRRLELGDAGVGEDPRVGPGLDGGVLGRQAEGVEAERGEHALALHGLVADGQVTEGVVAHVALVGGPGRVGVHAQRVVLRPGVVVVDLVGALLLPAALPLPLDASTSYARAIPPGYARPRWLPAASRSLSGGPRPATKNGRPAGRGARARLLA